MASPAAGAKRRVALAAVAGAHGVKGELRLKLFSDNAQSLARHPQLFIGGFKRRLMDIRESGKTAIARFEGIADRNAAEALQGALVEVDRAALPPLEEGEYYHADLIGLPCTDPEGRALGLVTTVENFGAGDLLEVKNKDGRRSLVPFKPGIADLINGQIVLNPEFLT